jgi:hypothetical protein
VKEEDLPTLRAVNPNGDYKYVSPIAAKDLTVENIG